MTLQQPARSQVALACAFALLVLLGCESTSLTQPKPGSGLDAGDAPAAGGHRETAGDLDWNEEAGAAAFTGLAPHSPMPLDLTVFVGEAGFPSYPLPDGDPEPLGRGLFRSGFRNPLPPSPVWNPAGAKRVGLQAGHWFTSELPHELRRLSPGSTAGGWAEWQVNVLIAQAAARLLEDAGVEVDLLGAVIPVRYRAHAFVAIHTDGDANGRLTGYKIARPGFSSIPETDDELVRIMYHEYGAATGMARDADEHISRRMLYYYAFNTRRYQHALDLGTPAAIIETGFLTHAGDRTFLTSRPELAAQGIASGILRFLELERGAALAK